MVSFSRGCRIVFLLLLVSASRWVRGHWAGSPCSAALLPCQGHGAPLVVEVEDPRHVSYLCFCSVVLGRLDQRNSYWETNPWVFLVWDSTPVSVLCCVPFCPLYRLTNYTSAGTTFFDPTLTVGIQANRPYNFSGVLSPGHWHNTLRSGPRTAVLCTWTHCGSCGDNSDSGLA